MHDKNHLISLLSALIMIAAVACGGDSSADDDDGSVDNGPPPTFEITGQVVDFETGTPLAISATVRVEGVVPDPIVSNQGSNFTIEGLPVATVVYLLSVAPPNFVNTYNKAVEIVDSDQNGLLAEAVSQAYLDSLAAAFGVTLDNTRSVFIGRAVSEDGSPLEGIAAADFDIPDQTPLLGPFFLDANKAPDAGLAATSASGYFAFFNLEPKPLAIAAAQGSDYNMTMAVSPTSAQTVTLADVVVRDGDAVVVPVDVSFANDVYPIFAARACAACHDKNAIGAAIGGLDLAHQKIDKVYAEITQELSPSSNTLRVNLDDPEQSLLLSKPGPPAGDHPNLTFASKDDLDYQTIRVWIAEGARLN